MTGSSGLIGARTADRLSAEFRVAGLDRPGEPHPPSSVENIPCDLTSDDSVVQALTMVKGRFGSDIAAVVHLAAYFDFSGEPSSKYSEVTVEGTRRLLRALHTLGFRVARFIFSSTMLVHKPCEPGEAITEDWPLDPRWPYPHQKWRRSGCLRPNGGTIRRLSCELPGCMTMTVTPFRWRIKSSASTNVTLRAKCFPVISPTVNPFCISKTWSTPLCAWSNVARLCPRRQ